MYSMSSDAVELPVGVTIRKKTNLQVGERGVCVGGGMWVCVCGRGE